MLAATHMCINMYWKPPSNQYSDIISRHKISSGQNATSSTLWTQSSISKTATDRMHSQALIAFAALIATVSANPVKDVNKVGPLPKSKISDRIVDANGLVARQDTCCCSTGIPCFTEIECTSNPDAGDGSMCVSSTTSPVPLGDSTCWVCNCVRLSSMHYCISA